MITVQNDWVTYEAQVVRPVAVRGGAGCVQRARTATERPSLIVPTRAAAPSRTAAATRPAAAKAAPAAAGPAPRLRLTRRGRIVLVVLPAVLASTAALVSLTAPLAEAQPARPARTIVVGTGDTLWSIAQRIAPQADPRDVVTDLERTNRLPGAAVQAGERLLLRAGIGG